MFGRAREASREAGSAYLLRALATARVLPLRKSKQIPCGMVTLGTVCVPFLDDDL
jgi:hypothetical protein